MPLSFLVIVLLVVVIILLVYIRKTPYGTIPLKPALIARAASLVDGPFDAKSRAVSDKATGAMIGSVGGTFDVTNRALAIPTSAGNVSCEVYTPAGNGPFPVLIWIHGGCWLLGRANHLDDEHRFIAQQSQHIVVSVDYRLSPEHPFPAGFNDCYDVALWLKQNASQLNGKPKALSIGGSSAGGNLAAAITLRARDSGELQFLTQYLQVPITDTLNPDQWASYTLCHNRYVPTARAMKEAIALYCPNESQRAHPYVSPYRADDLSDLPPAVITIAAVDPLRDEAHAYAEKLQQHGVSVDVHRFEQTIHGFIGSPKEMRASSQLAVDALNQITIL